MNKYTVEAVRITTYHVEVEAEDGYKALAALDDWVSDDFEDFEVDVIWEMNAIDMGEEDE